ncbi:MAG: hypothetical protein H3C47_06665 [Candidatus Cloacimonetes bacterium]|nr:hypothetical protein [Candidatus Cloacimonadota bacterium]
MKIQYLWLLLFVLCSGSIAEIPESVLLNRSFLLFRSGNHSEFLSQYSEKFGPGGLLESSRLNPLTNFERLRGTQQESTRSMMRSYLRELTSDTFYVAPPATHAEAAEIKKFAAVMHFEDGGNSHHMLVRISDNNYGLKVLKPVLEEGREVFSGMDYESYTLADYIELARLSKNRRIQIAVHEVGTLNPPKPTSYFIAVEPLEFTSAKAKATLVEPESSHLSGWDLELLDPDLRSRLQIERFLGKLSEYQNKEQQILEERKALVRMRLPNLNLDKARTVAQVNSLVQGEIIRRIFVPDPRPENCPGEFSENRCSPNGTFSDVTWKLYRQAYRMLEIGETVFDGRL